MKLTITIEAWYDPKSVDDADILQRDITEEIQRVIGEGTLAPYHTSYEVDTYEIEVKHDQERQGEA